MEPTAKPKTRKNTKMEAALPWSAFDSSIFGPYIITMLFIYPEIIAKVAFVIK